MSHDLIVASDDYVLSANPDGKSSIVLVCEHASCHIPPEFNALGLTAKARKSHAAWDLGAMAVATRLARRLDAPLVASGVSRLVYDCNRPPSSPDAMPARSEVFDVPGNAELDQAARDARVASFYDPFYAAVHSRVAAAPNPILITVHSFTPVYHGTGRAVEIGVLHDLDSRLADAMLQTAATHTQADVQRNAPYGPEHGVTHTLKEHAQGAGHLNVMIEIRNDLIETSAQQDQMADMISAWIVDACVAANAPGVVQCQG